MTCSRRKEGETGRISFNQHTRGTAKSIAEEAPDLNQKRSDLLRGHTVKRSSSEGMMSLTQDLFLVAFCMKRSSTRSLSISNISSYNKVKYTLRYVQIFVRIPQRKSAAWRS